jgi:flagellar basal body rod protein FlgG
MYEVISLERPDSEVPKDTQTFMLLEEAMEYAVAMSKQGYFVVVKKDGVYQYSFDGRA